jgi:hypothetical protein
MKQTKYLRRCALAGCISLGVLAGSGTALRAQDSQADAIAKLQQQNDALQKRLDALEDKLDNAGINASDPKQIGTPPSVSAATAMTISGFVQTSYFDNLENPSGGNNAGYLWNTRNNNFSINKVKITLASPEVQRSGDKWDAGYRLSLMAGEDAPILNSNSGTTGFDYLREAYVEANVPIGNGLDIKAGDMISLLNYESGDGGAVNENFSQGYQWYYTGNGPETGVQLDYAFTNWLDVIVRAEDGLYSGAISSRNQKGIMGAIDLKPTSKLWVNLIGFGGQAAGTESASGGEILAGYQITPKLGTGFEGDYFHLNADGNDAPSGDLWSAGTWIWYDFTPQVGLAFRGEILDDPNGVGINVSDPNSLAPAPHGDGISSPDRDGDLGSLTLTLNLKPTPNFKVQPEIRYNATSYSAGFDGKAQQIILGCGATYLY